MVILMGPFQLGMFYELSLSLELQVAYRMEATAGGAWHHAVL